MGGDAVVRPELVELDRAERERVLTQLTAKGGYCEACAGTEFDVGRALYLGFLFLDEDQDAYLVALTCRNPDCPQPHTAITLREKDFLSQGGDARAASWRASDPDAAWPSRVGNR